MIQKNQIAKHIVIAFKFVLSAILFGKSTICIQLTSMLQHIWK